MVDLKISEPVCRFLLGIEFGMKIPKDAFIYEVDGIITIENDHRKIQIDKTGVVKEFNNICDHNKNSRCLLGPMFSNPKVIGHVAPKDVKDATTIIQASDLPLPY